MKVEFELWQLITLAVMLGGAFTGVGKLMLMQFARSVEASIDQIRRDSNKWSTLEREFLRHLAELPIHYVRREDWHRGQSILETKLDKQFLMLQELAVRVAEKQGETR